MLKNRVRKLLENKLRFLGILLYSVMMGFMVVFMILLVYLMIIESGEITSSDGIMATVLVSLFSYYVGAIAGLSILTYQDKQKEYFFPSPVRREAIVLYRNMQLNMFITIAILVTGVFVTSALSVHNTLTPYQITALLVAPILSTLTFLHLITIITNLRKNTFFTNMKRVFRALKWIYILFPMIALCLIILDLFFGNGISVFGMYMITVLFWLPLILGYCIWGNVFHFIILMPILACLTGLAMKYSYEIQCHLLSEEFRESHVKKSRITRFLEKTFRIGEREYLPVFGFDSGAGVLKTKNLIFILRPPLKPLVLCVFFLGIIFLMMFGMPLSITLFLDFVFIFMLVGQMSKHISFEGTHLDKIRMLPANGRSIFWNYSLPTIYIILILNLLVLPATLLFHRPRIWISLAVLLIFPIAMITFYIVSQEGYIKKMRHKEIADVIGGKQKMAFSGMFLIIYIYFLFMAFVIYQVDVAVFLFYLSAVFGWFVFVSTFRIGKEMAEFLVPVKKKWRKRFRAQDLGFKVISLVIASLFLIIPWPYNFHDYPLYEYQGPIPDNDRSCINDERIIEDLASYQFSGSHLVIGNGGSVVIRNSHLIMNYQGPWDHSEKEEVVPGIYILEGGSLVLDNATITSDEPDGFIFEVYGSMVSRNSTIRNLWGDNNQYDHQGGLEIYSSDVLLENTTIMKGITNGIIIGDHSPTINNCHIIDNGDDGVEIAGGSPLIMNTIIENNSWGMVVYCGSGPRIVNTSISRNINIGLSVRGCSVLLENSTVEGNGGIGLHILDGKVNRRDTVIQNNDPDISDRDHIVFRDLLGPYI